MGNPQTSDSEDARAVNIFSLELQTGKGAQKMRRLDDFTVYFPVGVCAYSLSEPARNEPQQTLSSQYVELWGEGFKHVSIEGHTGFGENIASEDLDENQRMDGYAAFMRLRDTYREYLKITKANLYADKNNIIRARLVFRAWEENENWEVVPTGPEAFRRQRNEAKPLLFPFSLSMIGVRNLDDGDDDEDQSLMGASSLTDALRSLGGLGDFLIGVSDFFAAGNALAKSVGKAVKEAAGKVKGFIKGISSFGRGASKAFSGVTALAKEVRNLAKAVSSLAGLPAKLLVSASRALRQTWCALNDAARAFNLGNLGGIHQSAWDQALRTFGPC
jgi:hypothetical protein